MIMKRILIPVVLLFTGIFSFAQNRKIRFDFLTGINMPINSLNVTSRASWRLGGGVRYKINNRHTLNVFQISWDKFEEDLNLAYSDERENSFGPNTLALLTGYFYKATSRLHTGINAGVGFCGHNRIDRVAKPGINPVLSYEVVPDFFTEMGYHQFFGGYKNTSYFNFSLRYSF